MYIIQYQLVITFTFKIMYIIQYQIVNDKLIAVMLRIIQKMIMVFRFLLLYYYYVIRLMFHLENQIYLLN
jgi:hypothetical protein